MEGPNSMEVGSLEVKKNDKDPWSKTAYLGGRLVSKIPAVYSNDNKYVFFIKGWVALNRLLLLNFLN